MRKKLKNISEDDYWTYGLAVYDFNFIFKLTEKFINDREEILNQREEKNNCE